MIDPPVESIIQDLTVRADFGPRHTCRCGACVDRPLSHYV